MLYNLPSGTRIGGRCGDAVAEVFASATRDGAIGAASPAPPGLLLLSRMRTLLIARTRSSGPLRPSRDVDLWSIITAPDPWRGGGVDRVPSGSPSVEIVRGMVGRCGVVSSAVISMAYFGGYRIPEIAERLSMTAAECRSRCMGVLSTPAGIRGRHCGPGHDVRFSVCASAHALASSRQRMNRNISAIVPGISNARMSVVLRGAASPPASSPT